MHTTNTAATQIRFSTHSRDRIRQYGLREHELLAAIGPRIVSAGALDCPDAALGPDGAPTLKPSSGSPVRIGRMVPDPRRCNRREVRSVLLALTPNGRRLHVVCVPQSGAVLDIVTLWDPDSVENVGLWEPHAQMPTSLGDRSGVPTRWCLGDPSDPRRHRYTPRATR